MEKERKITVMEVIPGGIAVGILGCSAIIYKKLVLEDTGS